MIGPVKSLMSAMHGPVYRRRLEVLTREIGGLLRDGDPR